MNVVAFDLPMLSAMKRVLAAGLPVRSGHLSEALAAGFGFATHASLLAEIRPRGAIAARLRRNAFLIRLWSLHGNIDIRTALAAWTQAIVYGAEFSARPAVRITRFDDPLCDRLADGSRTIYWTSCDIASGDIRIALALSSVPPLASPSTPFAILREGRLVFDPLSSLGNHPLARDGSGRMPHGNVALRALASEAENGIRLGPEDEPRCIPAGANSAPIEDVLSDLDRAYDEGRGDMEAARVALWLERRIVDPDLGAICAVMEFSGRRLPRMIDISLCGTLRRRFSLRGAGGLDERGAAFSVLTDPSGRSRSYSIGDRRADLDVLADACEDTRIDDGDEGFREAHVAIFGARLAATQPRPTREWYDECEWLSMP